MDIALRFHTAACILVLAFSASTAGQPALEAGIADARDVVFEAGSTLFFPAGTVIRAPAGPPGNDVTGEGHVVAGDGGSGGNIILIAPRVTFGPGVQLIAGDGGTGGAATAIGNPDARAEGGDGGPGGQVIIHGTVIGNPFVQHGRGGPGGDAHATGTAACSGRPGQDQTVEQPPAPPGEPGRSANASGTGGTCGAANGTGGHGGNATAVGGAGGVTPAGPGVTGGNATAIAGKGGDGIDLCTADRATFNDWREQGLQAGHGGIGGAAFAYGGAGGDSLSGVGGPGGDANGTSAGGAGGNGTQLLGGRFLIWSSGYQLVHPGNGGTPLTGKVEGGQGGMGVVGGPGGSGAGHVFGGDGGRLCFIDYKAPTSQRAALAGSMIGVGAAALVAVVWIKRRRK